MNYEKLTVESLMDTGSLATIAGIEIDRGAFIRNFGEDQYLPFIKRLEAAGFISRGALGGDDVFTYCTDSHDNLFDEFSAIIEDEVIAD